MFKRKINKLLPKVLPAKSRKRISRSKLDVDGGFLEREGIILKVADTRDEITQAFALVQKVYEGQNIVDKNSSGLRITKYHLLPTTKVLIAKKGDKVIGTVSQIMDTSIGLPIDDMIPLGQLRDQSKRICEISSLAIDPEWRSGAKGLFFPLTLFSINYSRLISGADYLVIVTNDRVRFLYEDIFLFEPININSQDYQNVNDSSAFAQKLYLNDIEGNYFDIFKKYPPSKNMYNMLVNPPWGKLIDYANEKSPYAIVPLMHYDEFLLNELFEANSMLEQMSDSEKQVIYNLYSIYNKEFGVNLYISKRKFPRFYTKMDATISIDGVEYLTECIELSRGGGSFLWPKGMKSQKKRYELKIFFNDMTPCKVYAKVSWTFKNKIGFEILVDGIENWYSFMDEIEEDFRGHSSKAA